MADYGKSSIEIRPNERNETSERVIATNLQPADTGQVIQPFEDIARPTRRAETVGNIRQTGTPVRYEGGAPMVTVWDPQDIARTTVKETTIYLDRPGIAAPDSAPTRLKVYDPDDIARPTQKQQLSANLAWTGPSISASQDQMDETFAYNMRTNPNKEQIARGAQAHCGLGPGCPLQWRSGQTELQEAGHRLLKRSPSGPQPVHRRRRGHDKRRGGYRSHGVQGPFEAGCGPGAQYLRRRGSSG